MRTQAVAGVAILGGIVGLFGAGCESEQSRTGSGTAPSSGNGVYAVQILADTASDLPTCDSTTSGETAIVTSTDTLDVCIYGAWSTIPCQVGGSVAFDSATNTLWACTASGEGGAPLWMQVSLPQGATGPQGPAGTNGVNGEAGADSIVVQTPLSAGTPCAYGGTEIQSGLDLDGDGLLEPNEVKQTTYICNGAPGADGAMGATGPEGPAGMNGLNGDAGATSLVVQTPLTVAPCPYGGTEVQSGVDLDGDGILEPNEVLQTSYVCNGAPGAEGPMGTTGATGAQGPQGDAGPAGAESLVVQTPLSAGAICPFGGTEVQSGIDVDGDGILEPTEVQQTSYVCNGAPGADGAMGATGGTGAQGPQGDAGLSSLVSVTPVQSGSSDCPAGGQEIQTGIDLNGDGILEPSEVQQDTFVCNGPQGAQGPQGSQGPQGPAGMDGMNGTNGEAGAASLVVQTALSAGTTCLYGGTEIQSGVDLDGDGILEPNEVQQTTYVCNGAPGADGAMGATGATGAQGSQGDAGLTSLVSVTPLPSGSSACPTGGQEIQTGIDLNGDGVLEANEVQQDTFVCNGALGATGATGAAGASALVVPAPFAAGAGSPAQNAACPAGGTEIDTGTDDGTGHFAGTPSVTYVCNGATGPAGSSAVGDSSANPAASCAALLSARSGAASGVYWLMPSSAVAASQWYCDMTTDGGGWTLVWSNLRGGTNEPPTGMTWARAIGTLPLYDGIPTADIASFEVFTGLSHWGPLAPSGQFRTDWAHDYGVAVDERVECSFALAAQSNYALNLSACTQKVGTVQPGLVSYHNGHPFSTYDADHSVTGHCGTTYSYSPFWYVDCWSGSIMGWGDNPSSVSYIGAYWVGSADAWGTSDSGGATGAGNGWYLVR